MAQHLTVLELVLWVACWAINIRDFYPRPLWGSQRRSGAQAMA